MKRNCFVSNGWGGQLTHISRVQGWRGLVGILRSAGGNVLGGLNEGRRRFKSYCYYLNELTAL